jgi:hypothetical protein
LGLDCTPICGEGETAWAVNPGKILGFPGKNWATYFTYIIQPNLIGDWILRFVYEGNWDHDMTIITQDKDGNFAGEGGYPSGGPYSHP